MIKKIFSKLFHPPEYPPELPTTKGKVAYFYHWHMRLLDTGRGSIYGKFTQPLMELSWIMLLADKLGYANLTITQIAVFTIVAIVVIWFSGWLYVMYELDIVQQILMRYRDVMFKDMYERMKEMKK